MNNIFDMLGSKKDEIIYSDMFVDVTLEYSYYDEFQGRVKISEEEAMNSQEKSLQVAILFNGFNQQVDGFFHPCYVPMNPSYRDRSGWTTVTLPSLNAIGLSLKELHDGQGKHLLTFKMVENKLGKPRVVGDKVYEPRAIEFISYKTADGEEGASFEDLVEDDFSTAEVPF